MEIIDFEKKGNCIRLYLGKNGEQWGDDWNDAPYEHNAETVYREYVKGVYDYALPFGAGVYEPCDGEWNSVYSKEDMIKRSVPCLIIVAKEAFNAAMGIKDTFKAWLGNANALHIYFGDSIEEVEKKIFSAHGCNIEQNQNMSDNELAYALETDEIPLRAYIIDEINERKRKNEGKVRL